MWSNDFYFGSDKIRSSIDDLNNILLTDMNDKSILVELSAGIAYFKHKISIFDSLQEVIVKKLKKEVIRSGDLRYKSSYDSRICEADEVVAEYQWNDCNLQFEALQGR